jgi:hypothetical protein
MNKRVAILLMGLIAGWCCEAAADNINTLPSLKLTVIDSRSEKPLAGITVHHMVIRDTHWTVFPLTIEAHIDCSIAAPATLQTDSNGVVTFENIVVKLKSYWFLPKAQSIDSEVLFVNLDPLSDPPKYIQYDDIYHYLWSRVPFLENLYKPNKKYLGHILGISDISVAHESEVDNVATVRWEPGKFSGVEGRNFVVRLKPFSQTDAQP